MSFLSAINPVAAIGTLGSIGGGILQYKGTKDTNATNSAIAQQQMDFQRTENQKAMDFSADMANSQHQREVADLKAAGLNPILSAGGSGSASPSGVTSGGASYQAQNELAHAGNAINSAIANVKKTKEMKLLDEQIGLVNNQSWATTQQALKSAAEREKIVTENKNLKAINAGLENQAELDNSAFGKALNIINRTSQAVQGTGNSAKSIGVLRKTK